ncbi:MAG: alkaline phosphatase family protein [Acidobacteriaceae bacterium]|jgi:predicted AlkP superfamily pyrophosphatase or phosphodiesterase
MSSPKRSICKLFVALLVIPWTPPARASAYDAHPRLVIILVVDQLRGDYLDRYRADFKGRGFRLFLDKGAYFEDCYYDYANTKTAPGHATLGTGAYTDGHGIAANSWWDLNRNKTRPVTSVEDDRYRILGAIHPGKEPGASPLNLRASTVGDSLRLATVGQAKVFGISLKDRAAILPAGYSANGAYWIEPASGAFITSSYYMDALPDWVTAFNSGDRATQAEQEAGDPGTRQFYEAVGSTPAGNAYELDFARALITGEQLGNHPVTDMLVISLSANDLVGHRDGPDSPQARQMVDTLDQQLDGFFSWLDKNIPGGLANTWIALSADHGVAPVPAHALALGMPAATIDMNKFVANLNDTMNAKFSPGEKVEYLLPQQELPYLSLNRPSFEVAGINELEAEQAIQQAVPAAVATLAPAPGTPPVKVPEPPVNPPAAVPPPTPPPLSRTLPPAGSRQRSRGRSTVTATNTVKTVGPPATVTRQPAIPIVVHTYTRQQLALGELPPSEWGLLLAHSYSPNGGWYVMVIPAAYQMQTLSGGGTTHFSPWSYDRHVPLGFFGAPFTPGIYHGRVQPVDLAATLASVLGVTQPSASVGNVLTQAIHTVPPPPGARGSKGVHQEGPPSP